jgi:hypothetical protein
MCSFGSILLNSALLILAVSGYATNLTFNASIHLSSGPNSSLSTPISNHSTIIKHKSSPIIAHGNKFYNSETGEQFFIKGIAYQPSRLAGDAVFADLDASKFIDPLAEPKICLRDLPYLVELGVNTVRVYSIDTNKDHGECFDAFAKAGIYVLADLSEPDASIVRDAPTWDVIIQDRYTKVVDSLNAYDNLLGFFAGNEVTNDRSNTDASPFVKSSIRDTKNYIKSKGYRQIPVGYSTNDDAATRASLADYFSCGEEIADFYGINIYEWCGYSTFHTSGYKERTNEFKDYPIPAFFSEFGCNVNRPRPFTEIEALYGGLMTDVWSGGIAYMFFEEPNQYGVVKLIDGKVNKLGDFATLQHQYTNASPKGVKLAESKLKPKIQKVIDCPAQNEIWAASPIIPHAPDSAKCECMVNGLECQLDPQVKESELASIFKYACDIVNCEHITGDGKTGTYGDFSDCSAKQKASYVINGVYKARGSQKKDCDFNGMATLNKNVLSTQELSKISTNSGQVCLELLNEHNYKQKQSSVLMKAANNTTNNTANNTANNAASDSVYDLNKTSLDDGNRTEYSNRASQVAFFCNISQAVGLSAILIISLALIF